MCIFNNECTDVVQIKSAEIYEHKQSNARIENKSAKQVGNNAVFSAGNKPRIITDSVSVFYFPLNWFIQIM